MQGETSAMNILAKIIIIGDAGVGKTCLLLRYCDDNFLTSHLPTIGIDFKMKTVQIDNKTVRMQVWDTAGQERFKTITQTYFKSAQGVVLAYAVNDRDSFKNLEDWINQVRKFTTPDVSIVLVGNKSDMPDRAVSYDEGKALADQNNFHFFETSTKDDTNIKPLFQAMLHDIIKKAEKNIKSDMNGADAKLALAAFKQHESPSKCC